MEHPSFEYLEPSCQRIEAADPIDKIAFVAHNCYKVSPKDHQQNLAFVKRLIANGHLAMIEHAYFTAETSPFLLDDLQHFNNPFIRYTVDSGRLLVSFSMRPLIENASSEDLHARKTVAALGSMLPAECQDLIPNSQGWASPYHGRLLDPAEVKALPDSMKGRHVWLSYLLRTDRGVTHELVRHRPCSFAQESTRYCNYSKDKFGNQISVIRPLDYQGREDIYDSAFENAAESYFRLLSLGALPQQARAVLPNALKADLVITASLKEWDHIFTLRLAPAAHPECRRVLRLVCADMIAQGWFAPGYIEERSR